MAIKIKIFKNINECIEKINTIVKNASNIMKFIDPKKVHNIIIKPNKLTKEYLNKLEKGFYYIFNKERSNGDIDDVVNFINIVGIEKTTNQNLNQNSNKKKYIICGVIVAAIVVCGAIWYWKSNQDSNIEI